MKSSTEGIEKIMNDCKISIIIPVYNVESYIKRCVDSIINQTYKNIEIILVDDGSRDKSGDICDELAKTDTRIKVLHKNNGGLSEARNFGVECSTGEFITFIDSDDYVSHDYIEYLYSLVFNCNADIATICFYRTEKDIFEGKTNDALPELTEMSGREACCKLLEQKLYYVPLVIACAKLIRTSIVRKYPFPVGKKHEDEATTAKFLYSADKVVVSNRELYAYYQNPHSITHTKGTLKNNDAIWALYHRAQFFDALLEKKLAKMSYTFLFDYLARDSFMFDRRCDKEIHALVKGKQLTFRGELYRLGYKISPRIYIAIRRFL
ncbi:glycosyltransferase family 2 protein [Massilimicrobiota sp. An105]|uniref:glycosyltransferase family 2 protein n=1 Tax=Massilimicrobiota sp. An105 TaxID=1965540 RepID=UPI0019D0E555|nr:glycosyltransferase family 2 protein [Massilimicrobiota sp. An105]